MAAVTAACGCSVGWLSAGTCQGIGAFTRSGAGVAGVGVASLDGAAGASGLIHAGPTSPLVSGALGTSVAEGSGVVIEAAAGVFSDKGVIAGSVVCARFGTTGASIPLAVDIGSVVGAVGGAAITSAGASVVGVTLGAAGIGASVGVAQGGVSVVVAGVAAEASGTDGVSVGVVTTGSGVIAVLFIGSGVVGGVTDVSGGTEGAVGVSVAIGVDTGSTLGEAEGASGVGVEETPFEIGVVVCELSVVGGGDPTGVDAVGWVVVVSSGI